MNPVVSFWKEIDHPRDRLGRFRSKWSVKGPAKELIDAILETVEPRQFGSPQQAHVYLNRKFEGGKPGGRKAVLDYLGNFRAINAEMKAGQNPPEAEALRSSMQPLPDDLMLTQSTTPQAFGLDASSLGLLEELTGKVVRDRTFTTAWLGPTTNNGGIQMHILAPEGTNASHVGGVEVLLSDKVPYRITHVNQNPDGTYTVAAIALPESEGANAKTMREAMLEGQREGNEEAREQGLPESTEVMPAQDTTIPERMPARNPAGADVLAPVEAKGTGDSSDGFEADGRQSWVKDGQPITIGPGRSGGEIGVYQGDRIVATAPDIEMLPQAAARADLPEVARWARSNKQTPLDRMGPSAKEAADRAATNRADSEEARTAEAERANVRKERERASDERWEGRDKKIAARQAEARKKLPKLADRKQEEKPEPTEEEKERRIKRLEDVRAAQPKFKPGDRGGIEDRAGDEIIAERNAPRPLKKLTKKAANNASSGELMRSMREGRLSRAETKKLITERVNVLKRIRADMGDSDSDVRAERIDARLVEEQDRLAELEGTPRKSLKKLAPAKSVPDGVSEPVEAPAPAKKALKKAAKAGPRGAQKGDIIEWTDENADNKVIRGEILSRQRDGSVTVQWDGGRRETGVDPDAASMRFRRREEGDAPITPIKKALKKAAPAKVAKKAAPSVSFEDAKNRIDDWDNPPSREEIRNMVDNVSTADLRRLGEDFKINGWKRKRLDDLRADIVEYGGRRIDSIAVRGFRGRRPGDETPGDRPINLPRRPSSTPSGVDDIAEVARIRAERDRALAGPDGEIRRRGEEEEARPPIPARKTLPRAQRNADREDVIRQLNDHESDMNRQQAADLVDRLSTPDLRAVGKAFNVPRANSMKLDQLRQEIVEATVGRRLDSIAIRGFRGRAPGVDTPSDRSTDAEQRIMRQEGGGGASNVRSLPPAKATSAPERDRLATVTPLKRVAPSAPETPPAKKAPAKTTTAQRDRDRLADLIDRELASNDPDLDARKGVSNAPTDRERLTAIRDRLRSGERSYENFKDLAQGDALQRPRREAGQESVFDRITRDFEGGAPIAKKAPAKRISKAQRAAEDVEHEKREDDTLFDGFLKTIEDVGDGQNRMVTREQLAGRTNLSDSELDRTVARLKEQGDIIELPNRSGLTFTPDAFERRRGQERNPFPTRAELTERLAKSTPAKKALPSGRDEDDARRQQSRNRAESLTERMDRLRTQREQLQREEARTQQEIGAKQVLDAVKKALPTLDAVAGRPRKARTDDLDELIGAHRGAGGILDEAFENGLEVDYETGVITIPEAARSLLREHLLNREGIADDNLAETTFPLRGEERRRTRAELNAARRLLKLVEQPSR